MPEAAEVAKQGIWLNQWVGAELVSIQLDEKSKFFRKPIPGWNLLDFNKGYVIQNVFTRGKIIVICLITNKKEKLYITSHLGMTGFYTVKKSKHTNIWFSFANHPTLYFNDQRHFGNFTICENLTNIWKKNGPCLLTSALVRYGKLSIDSLNEHQIIINRKKWHSCFKKQEKEICDFLIEQKAFSGLGNYLRVDVLYKAKISPFRKIKDLSLSDIDTLYEKTMEIVYLSFKPNYHFKVYMQETDSLGNPVKTIKSKGRTIHYCPNIQV